MRQSVLRRIAWYIGICVLIAFAFSGLLYFSTTGASPEIKIDWKLVLTWQAIVYGWAILLPFIHLFSRKFSFEQRLYWLHTSIAHCVAAFLFIVLHTAIYAGLYEIIHNTFFQTENIAERIRFLFLRNWTLDLATYGLIVGLISAYDYYRRFQAEQMNSAELKAQLVNSQLQTLKMQLHPHFLFNTLNSISALIHEDADAADKMVARLGDFLRLTLENSGEQQVALRKEIEFLNRYLEIERVRFQDRLTVETDIEPATLAARVPNLILQPIIENAIRHGVSKQTGPGRIFIRARRVGEKLIVEIEDNGPGLDAKSEVGNSGKGGIGLANTRSRLLHLYGENHSLQILNVEPSGVWIALEIPFEISKTETTAATAKNINENEKVAVN